MSPVRMRERFCKSTTRAMTASRSSPVSQRKEARLQAITGGIDDFTGAVAACATMPPLSRLAGPNIPKHIVPAGWGRRRENRENLEKSAPNIDARSAGGARGKASYHGDGAAVERLPRF